MARPEPEDLLAPYRRKRDFTRTPEPAGGGQASDAGRRRFVVQRHRARRLHYDLRFEIDGVLASWAVPKGPTLDPDVRRLAVHVEDHPLEYELFEGIIPAGEYGGGDVIVWDRGTWEPVGTHDPAAAVRAGDFHVDLCGERLKGRFALVRRGGTDRSGKEQWLLVHKHDEYAQAGWDAERFRTSVLTGRTNDEVKAAPERLWRSDLPADRASVPAGESLVEGPSADELSALADLDGEGTWDVFGRTLKVTNLDKVLFPGHEGEAPVTKRELIAYAARIAPVLVPYLRDRALNMHRYPDGAGAKGFWHKEVPDHAPEWVTRWHNPDADPDETQNYVVVDEPATLVWVAGFGALEWHPWTSPTSAPAEPSYVLFDLDPGNRTTWDELLALGRLHRTAFEHLDVRAYPKVTGRRGIQIWVPIAAGPGFDETRTWAERVSRTVGTVVPDLVSWKWVKSDRKGLARLDYTQNAVNKTLVAPYSPRPSAGAPVSTPIRWDELDDPNLRPDRWTMRTILDRVEEHGDLFRGVLTRDQHLPTLR